MITFLWLCMPCAALIYLVVRTVRTSVELQRSRGFDDHFLSARALLQPAKVPRKADRPAAATAPSSPRIAAGERLVLAAGYLHAEAAGDQRARHDVLAVASHAELVSGLSQLCRMLAEEHADATGRSTEAVLLELHERAISRHRENVVLA